MVEAASNVAALIHQENVDQLWLCGIAGTFDGDAFEPGSAMEFAAAQIYGIGVGEGSHHQTQRQLGWCESDPTEVWGREASEPKLLTVAAASANATEAERRRRLHENVVAEDMETFAVAQVCRRMGRRLRVFRGCSNRVGDRDKSRWSVDAACRSVAELVRSAAGTFPG